MIRINLVGGDRQKARPAAFDAGRLSALLCGVVLVASVLGIGWWYWSLATASARVDEEIVAAQNEQARLQSVLAELKQFETRKAQLQQRVQLIEQLRGGQSLPVQVLDHVSRSLPDTLWLTSLEQEGDVLTIEGRSTTLIALSDFVGNLAGSSLLRPPVEILTSKQEPTQAVQGKPSIDVTTFSVKAQLAPTQQAVAASIGGAPAGVAGTGAPR